MGTAISERSSSRRVQAVSFDLDGTFYHVRSHMIRIGWRLLPHFRVLQAWQRAVADLRGQRHEDLRSVAIARMACSLQRAEADIDREMRHVLDDIWTASLTPSVAFKGLRQAMELLDQAGVPRAVASDHPPAERVRRLGLDFGWALHASGEELGAFKPLPDVLLSCASAMAVSPERLLHIGDRDDTDGLAAEKAGALFIQVGGRGVPTTRLCQIIEDLLEI